MNAAVEDAKQDLKDVSDQVQASAHENLDKLAKTAEFVKSEAASAAAEATESMKQAAGEASVQIKEGLDKAAVLAKEASDVAGKTVNDAVESVKKEVLGDDGKFDEKDVERMANDAQNTVKDGLNKIGEAFKGLFKKEEQ